MKKVRIFTFLTYRNIQGVCNYYATFPFSYFFYGNTVMYCIFIWLSLTNKPINWFSFSSHLLSSWKKVAVFLVKCLRNDINQFMHMCLKNLNCSWKGTFWIRFDSYAVLKLSINLIRFSDNWVLADLSNGISKFETSWRLGLSKRNESKSPRHVHED